MELINGEVGDSSDCFTDGFAIAANSLRVCFIYRHRSSLDVSIYIFLRDVASNSPTGVRCSSVRNNIR